MTGVWLNRTLQVSRVSFTNVSQYAVIISHRSSLGHRVLTIIQSILGSTFALQNISYSMDFTASGIGLMIVRFPVRMKRRQL